MHEVNMPSFLRKRKRKTQKRTITHCTYDVHKWLCDWQNCFGFFLSVTSLNLLISLQISIETTRYRISKVSSFNGSRFLNEFGSICGSFEFITLSSEAWLSSEAPLQLWKLLWSWWDEESLHGRHGMLSQIKPLSKLAGSIQFRKIRIALNLKPPDATCLTNEPYFQSEDWFLTNCKASFFYLFLSRF